MSTLLIDDVPLASTGDFKVMLATPVYENPDVSYTWSIHNSRQVLANAGIASSYLVLAGNCHVDDARNTIVYEFLKTDCTDLIFLDADVAWSADSLVRLCSFDVAALDIVGGVYPYRREGSVGCPVMPLGDIASSDAPLIEVEGLPTGFMRIRRQLLERMVRDGKSFINRFGATIPLVFERTCNGNARFGGDINFCLKARELGGKVWAASEIRLGHATKSIRWGSFGSALRSQAGTTLKYAVDKLRHGGFTSEVLSEAIECDGNPWGAPFDVLTVAIALARKAEAPILELGSGLSTILMAAVTEHEVHCLEHAPEFARRTTEMANAAGLSNVRIHAEPIMDRFYNIRDPNPFPSPLSFLLVDGPPRSISNRLLFEERLHEVPDTILFDDADNYMFKVWAEKFAKDTGRIIPFINSERALLMMREAPS